MALEQMQFQFERDETEVDPVLVRRIIQLNDFEGNVSNVIISNSPNNILWTSINPVGRPAYIQWLAAGNTPLAPAQPSLIDTVAQQRGRIDRAAFEARGRYRVPGQEAAFAAKKVESDTWVRQGEPGSVDDNDFPWAAQQGDDNSQTTPQALGDLRDENITFNSVDMQVDGLARRGNIALAGAADNSGAVAIGDGTVAALDAA